MHTYYVRRKSYKAAELSTRYETKNKDATRNGLSFRRASNRNNSILVINQSATA